MSTKAIAMPPATGGEGARKMRGNAKSEYQKTRVVFFSEGGHAVAVGLRCGKAVTLKPRDLG